MWLSALCGLCLHEVAYAASHNLELDLHAAGLHVS